jgi:hypothetical protein
VIYCRPKELFNFFCFSPKESFFPSVNESQGSAQDDAASLNQQMLGEISC